MAKQLNVNLAFNADVSQAKAQIQDLQSQLSRLTMNPTAGGKLALTDDIRRASQAAAELQAHLNKAYNAKTGNLDFSKLNQSISQSGKSLSQYGDQLRKLGPAGQQAFASLASSVAQAEVPIRRSNQLVNNLATTLKNTARWQLSSSILHGFMGSLQSAYGYAKDLDKSLTNIRIVTGQSTDQMRQFAVQANKAAKELSTTTVKYTDAALIYYQQGLGDSEVKERTDVTTKMANVTGEGVEEVSSYMTAIWNNFNKAGDQSAEHFADIMTKLGAETAASTDEIAAGLSKFSAVADTIGLSFEMASSSVTAIVDQTRESPEVVGTALKTIFSRIEGLKMGETLEDGMDLNKYSEGLAKVGVHIYDANGNLRDMDSVLQDIGGTWEELEKDEQVALAQTVAGVRQYNQFMALFDNWGHVEENLEMAAEAGGTLQEQADIYAESWQGASNRVRASLESIWMALLDDKAFIGMLNTIADVIGHIDNMIDTVGGLQGVLTMLGATLTTVFGKQMAQGLTNMAYNLQMMTTAGREKVKQQKTDFINDAANALNTGENQTKADTASSDGLKRQLTAQNALIENAERMNDIERETVQILMEQARARDEEVVAAASDVDAAEIKRDNLRDDITGNVYSQANDTDAYYGFMDDDLGKISQASKAYAEIDYLIDEIGKSSQATDAQIDKLQESLESLGASDAKNKIGQVLEGGKQLDADARRALIEAKEDASKQKKNVITETQANSQISFKTPKDQANYYKQLENYSDAIVDVEKKTQKANKANKDAEKTYDDLDKKIKSAKGAQQTWADGVMKGAQAASTLAMSIQIAQGVVSTLKNPDMSGWEKFVSITASVGMALPMIISSITALKDLGAMMSTLNAVTSAQIAVRQALGASYTAENIAIIQNIAAKSGLTAAEKAKQISEATGIPIKEAKIALENADSLATNTGIAGKLASAAATWQQAHANMGLLATMPPLLLAALALGAALAAVGVVAYLIIKNTNKAAKEAKAAAETAQSMKEAYESSKDEVESLNSAIDELKTKREALNSLTKGTEEWNQKLQESNDAVLALIEKYPELAKYMFTDSDGVMQISDAGLAELQKRKEEEVNQARVASQSANIAKNETQIEANKEDMRKQFTSVGDKGTTTMSDYHFEKVLSLIQAKGTDFSKNDLMAAVGQNQDYYNQVMDSLPEIINLIGENNALQEASDVYAKELANAILKQGGASEEDMSQAGLTGAIASEYDKEYQSQKDNWDKGWWQGVTKQDIIDEYVKLNPDMTLTDKNGGKGKAAKFKDADGNAIEVTVDEMIEAIASNNAMDAVAEKWDAVANKLLGINESELAKGLSGNLGETVLSGGKNEDFDLSAMTRDDILELSKKEDVTAADLGITKQAALDAGYTEDSEGMEAYARDFMNAIRNEAQNYGLDNGENVGKNIDFSNMSDEDVLELEKQMRKGRIDSADDVGITEEEAKQQGYESADAFFEAWKEGLQNEKAKIDNGEDRQSDGDEWFNYEQTRDKELYADDEASSGLRESRISKKERDQILTEAGKTEEDFNTEKDSVEDSIKNNQDMADSYEQMQEAYEKYSKAKKEGKDIDEALTKEEKKLAREYDKLEKQMEDVAACGIEMNDGFQDIVDNQERWRKALNKSNKGTKEYAKAMNEVRASVAKVLNVEEDAVSDDFLAEHFELAVDAANNVDGAMEQLREAFGQDYVAKMDISPPEGSDVETVRQELNSIVSGLSAEIEDLELGATLDDSQYIASLNNMLAQGTITQQQVNDILGGMGYEPQIEMVSKSVSVGGWPKAAIPVNILGFDLGTIPANFIPQVNFDVKVPKITGGNKKSNTSTATPSSGSKPSSGSPQSGGGGGGGGGGGSSKPKKADKKKKKDEIERYHEVKNSLEDLEKALDKVDKAKDRAWGKDKMKAIKEEIDLLDKEIGLQEQYLDEINTNYTKDKKALNKYGVEFDADGNISNYDEVMEEQIDIFNSKRTEAAEKAYENFKEAIEQYEETHDLWLDEKAAYQDMLDEKYDKLTELATAEFEITMEIDDQTQEYLDWLIGQSEDDIFQAADRIASINLSSQSTANANNSENGGEELIRDILENDNHNLSQKTIEGFLNNEDWAVNKVSKETFTADEIEQLEEGAAAMREAAAKLREDEAAIHEELSNIISETTDQMDRQIDIIDTLTDMIQTYVDIVDVVGKKVLKISNSDIKNLERSSLEGSRAALRSSKEEYETLKTERETLYAEYKRIEATLDETSKARWRERLQEVDDAMLEAQSDYTSRWQETLEKAAEIFENEVTRTLEEFNETMTGAFKGSLEELQEAFDQQQEISQLYVQDYKKIYELSKLTRDISTSIDKTDNLEATRELADLQKTIAEYEEAGVQMSQYEIDHLRKKYELKLAEIALEESQNAKSQVRMQRDSEGNYGYVYTANEEDVAAAEQSYEDKLYEMQELNGEYINELQSNILQLQQDLAEELANVNRADFENTEEYTAKLEEIKARYYEKMGFYTSQMNTALDNQSDVYENDWAKYSEATGYKISANEDFVDSWDETTLAVLTGFESIQDYAKTFYDSLDTTLGDLSGAFDQWYQDVDGIMEDAGSSIETFGEDVEKTVGNNKDGLIKDINDAENAVSELRTAFEQLMNTSSEKATTWYNSWNKKMQDLAKQAGLTSKAIVRLLETGKDDDDKDDKDDDPPKNDPPKNDPPKNNTPTFKVGGKFKVGKNTSIYDYAGDTSPEHQYYDHDPVYTLLKTKKVNGKTWLQGRYHKLNHGVSGWFKKSQATALDTGGYTGDWGTSDGRWALLHQKEIVLNKEDTENFLKAIDIVRDLSSKIDLNASLSQNGIGAMTAAGIKEHNQTLEQQVSIQASFPNATNHSEIEQAFENLVNMAAQYANRK